MLAAGATTLVISLSACADAEVAERISDDVDVVDVDVQQDAEPGATDPGIVDQIGAVACEAEFKTLSIAVEAFWAMEGRAPTSEDELVGTFLREPVSGYDISPTGEVVPATAGACA